MIGKVFGCYKVIKIAEDLILPSGQKKKRVLCECVHCNTLEIKDPYKVSHNNYQYCNNCRPIQRNVKKVLNGDKFGKLTVIERAKNHIQPNGSSKIMWLCACDCGEFTIVSDDKLKSGHTKSCGCYAKEKLKQVLVKDLIGTRSGKLLVIKKAYLKNGRQYWFCRCDCGNICIASSTSLTTNKGKSCGCLSSVAEYQMQCHFNQNGILSSSQYTFEECKYKRKLPFDFAIFHPKTKKLLFLIELNGEQHYYPYTFANENSDKKKENLKQRKKLDAIKRKFCTDNKIPLLIIKYTEFEIKEKIFDEFYKKVISDYPVNDYIFNSQVIKKNVQTEKTSKRKIVQIDLRKKEIVNYFDSIKDACRLLGIRSESGIIECCKKRSKIAHDYTWAYNDEFFDLEKTLEFATAPNKTVAKKIIQKDKENKIIKEWNSITEAAKYYGIKYQNIQACCVGKQKTSGGFKWEYK